MSGAEHVDLVPIASIDARASAVKFLSDYLDYRPTNVLGVQELLTLRQDDQAEVPSRRPGVARSRADRRGNRLPARADHARLALRSARDSPRGGRRDGTHPLTPPDCWHRPARPTISETCPPGEDIALACDISRDPPVSWLPQMHQASGAAGAALTKYGKSHHAGRTRTTKRVMLRPYCRCRSNNDNGLVGEASCLGGGGSTALGVVSRRPEASRWRPDARTQLPM
jgi:hypothetical protein